MHTEQNNQTGTKTTKKRRAELYKVEGYNDGDRFGEAQYRPERFRMIRAATAELAEKRAAAIWESQGIRPEMIIALPVEMFRR